MALAPGTRLGRYEILSLVGAGGMGEVYKARDTRLDRTVAIKILPSQLAADPQFRKRFDREARTISQLDHPHICALHDVGDADGTAFLVMQYLEGETLFDRLSKGPLPLAHTLQLALQMADALDAAHAKGIIHRDLKPANLFVTKGGAIKVLDFGLAKICAGVDAGATIAVTVPPLTTSRAAVGTVSYMSPEQARGDTVDARSDLFSLGTVLYEMATGQRAFQGATAAVIYDAILNHPPCDTSGLTPELPPALVCLIRKALAKDPRERVQSAQELREALNAVKRSIESPASATASDAATVSIAVLPFANMSAEKDAEYFSDGLAEEIINVLAQIPGLRVVGRTSSFFFRGKDVEFTEIRKKLNVTHILEGSVRKIGNRVRVTAQLIKAADGFHLWSERYDRLLEEVFEIQDEISLAIVKALRVKLLGEERAALAKRHTENVEAYQLYLKGRHHWHKFTEEGLFRSKECMQQAIRLDPDYALAHCGLADVYLAMGGTGSRPTDILPHAKAALTRALELDQNLAEVWVLLAVTHVYDRDWASADRAVARAIELDPQSSHAYLLAGIVALFESSGRLEEALAATTRAVALDPLAQMWNCLLAETYLARGDDDRSFQQIRAVLELDPSFWFAHFLRGILVLKQGGHAEAIQAFEDAIRCSGGIPFATGYQACALALAGEHDRAAAELRALHERSNRRYIPALSIAFAYVGLGQTERVFDWLERAYDEHEFWLPWHLQYDPQFASLRHDSRMMDLVQRCKVAAAKQ